MKKLKAKDFRKEKLEELKETIKKNDLEGTKFAIITSGTDDASKVYIKQKVKLGKKLDLCPEVIDLNEGYHFTYVNEGKETEMYVNNNSDTEDVRKLIMMLDKDRIPVIVQSPLDNGMDEDLLENTVDASLDIDGLSEASLANCILNGNKDKGFSSCTPEGIIDLLKYNGIDLEGKNVLLIGRSKIVGKPMIGLLLKENANVKVVHSKTPIKVLLKDLKENDVIISQVGIPKFFGVYDVKNDAVIVDVSMNRNKAGKLCGDFSNIDVEGTDIQYTPVPGGVGPMTVYELMKHVVESQLKSERQKK